MKLASTLPKEQDIVVCLSGRGDKVRSRLFLFFVLFLFVHISTLLKGENNDKLTTCWVFFPSWSCFFHTHLHLLPPLLFGLPSSVSLSQDVDEVYRILPDWAERLDWKI